MKHSILKKIVITGLSVLFFVAVFFMAAQVYVKDLARPYLYEVDTVPVCDAILVLGARVYENNTPSPVLKDRLEYAYSLYQAKKAPKIIVSGDHGTEGYDEVNTMLEYLLGKGVLREDIFLDHAGFDTYDSVYRAKEIFLCKSVIISTQDFHISRAVYVARAIGLEAYGAPCPDKAIYNMAYNNARETLARTKAIFDAEIFKRTSKYLGEPIPVWGDGSVTDG